MRDIRPFTTRLSEGFRGAASGLALGMTAGLTYLEPAVIDLAVPLSALYALWVLTRRVKLPIRLPRSAGCPDYSTPPRHPKTQAGQRHAFHRLEHDRPRTLDDRRGRTAAHYHPGHDRRR